MNMKSREISRRDFIKNLGSGAIGAGVALNVLPLAGNAMPEKDGNALEARKLYPLSITVNGKKTDVKIEPQMTLVELLRDKLKLTGTKTVCNHGECGACTVLLDGLPVYSCHMLALDANGKTVTTIEGLMTGETLHPIQEAFIDHDGLQCGFCTPGQIMAAQGLLLKHPVPTKEQVIEGLSGNVCRCAAYPGILKSVLAAAEKNRKDQHSGK